MMIKKDTNQESNDPFKINFVGIGFPKCGTTWIAKQLEIHPEIDFAARKETNFFLNKANEGNKYIPILKNTNEYKKEFQDNTGRTKIRGEFSVRYIFDKDALKKIKNNNRNMKIIIAIRNPIDYLYSAYWFDKSSNKSIKVQATFEKAMKHAKTEDFYNPEKAYFSQFINPYLNNFKRSDILILTLDEIKNSPKNTRKKIYNFLKVKNINTEIENQKINPNRKYKNGIIAMITYYIVKCFYKLKLEFVIHKLSTNNSIVLKIFNYIFKSEYKYPQMSKRTRKMLIQRYKQEIKQLERITKQDLSHWIKPNKTNV